MITQDLSYYYLFMKSILLLLLFTSFVLGDFNIPLCNKTTATYKLRPSKSLPQDIAVINYFTYAQNGS